MTGVDEVAEVKHALVNLSKLIPVPIKTVWPTEPYNFTPWLQKNAELLSETLGIDVELEKCEHPVGRFALDILGREVATGSPVIIENQFGPTDHGHLGQILTYAGGTKPTTIVWIAEQFREEHRAALEWLNTHTDPAIRFFGVRLAAVTLRDAPEGLIAPFLELVVKPNDWEKQALAVASAGSPATKATNELYREFWSRFEPVAKQHGWTNGSAPAQNWWSLPAGLTGATWTVSFAMFGCRSELFFNHADPNVNLAKWQVLASQRDAINDQFGDGLIFDDLPENKGCRIEARLDGPKIADREQWPSVLSWFVDTQERLRSAINSVGGIPTVVDG